MSIGQSMLAEFDHEMATTRRALERLPEDKLEWKPDPRSMTLGRLAGHVAEMPSWGAVTMNTPSLDLQGEDGKPKFTALVATSREQLLAAFDKNVADSRSALASAGDEAMMTEWKLIMGGHVIMAMPRMAIIRSMVMNHTIHHRGQLTVYYRMNGVPVPALYGPSADEGMAAGA
jgi:uncharacterized damage-inducible protein DinB